MSQPRVVIGVPLYQGGPHFRETLESLLSQDFRDLRIVITDEGGEPEAAELIKEYRSVDNRIEYARNPERLGMIFNWRAAFELGREQFPEAEYFAWASDHDVWHPYWVSSLVAELDRSDSVVAAYPRVHGVDLQGEPLLPGANAGFSTLGERSPSRRLAAAVDKMAAGNMVYALFRATTLAECGVFPIVLLPDRLLLAKLALKGEFAAVPHVLWYRRFVGIRPSLDRQRAAFFPRGIPAYARLPWWLIHGAAMVLALAWRGEGRPTVGRIRGLFYALEYFGLTLRFHLKRRQRRMSRDLHRFRKRLRRRRQAARKALARVIRSAQRRYALAKRLDRRLKQLRRQLRRLRKRLRLRTRIRAVRSRVLRP